jgi:hypothetical protein
MTDSAVAVDLPAVQQIQLAQCLSDLIADRIFREVSQGLLRDAVAHMALAPGSTAVLNQLGDENVQRWKRLQGAAPFIMSLGDHLTDGRVDAVLAAGAPADSPAVKAFRNRVHQEGTTAAAFVRSRLLRVPADFSAEQDKSIALFQAVLTYGDGSSDGPRLAFDISASEVACAVGIADVAVGGVGFGVAVAAEVLSAGASTPLSLALATASASLVGYGAGLASSAC